MRGMRCRGVVGVQDREGKPPKREEGRISGPIVGGYVRAGENIGENKG